MAGFTWSCGPTDTPPQTHTTSDLATARESASRVARRLVGTVSTPVTVAPARSAWARNGGSVRAPDAPGRQRQSRVDQLVAGHDQPEARPSRAAARLRARRWRARRARRGRPRGRRGARCRLPARLRRAPDVGAQGHRGHADPPVALVDALERHHRGCALGDGGTRRDANRVTGSDSRGRRVARPRLTGDGQVALGVRGEGEAVHRRRVEGRDVHGARDVLRQHAAEGVRERHLLGRERVNGCQDEALSLVDRHVSGHPRILPAPGAAMGVGSAGRMWRSGRIRA